MQREYTEQELIRREALSRMDEAGLNPYAYSWAVTHHAEDILDSFDTERSQPDN